MSEQVAFSEDQLVTLLADPTLRSLFDSQVEAFWVTTIPSDVFAESYEWHHWSVRIVRKSFGRWAVDAIGGNYDAEGNSQYETIPSERTEKFIEKFRHSLDVAVPLAFEIARTQRVNGLTAEEYANWYKTNHMNDGGE